MKKLMTILCAVCLLFLQTVPALAATKNPVGLMWSNVQQVECNVNILGTSGEASCTVIGLLGTTSISGSATLYEDGIEIDSWDLTGIRKVSLNQSFTGKSGKTYRLELDVDVTRNGVVEPIKVEDSAKCP